MLSFGKDNGMDLAGYERKQAVFEIDFEATKAFDENGAAMHPWIEDWYNVDQFKNSCEKLVDTYDTEYYRGEITYKGKKQYVYAWHDFQFDLKKRHMKETFTVLVPAGYDGMVVGVSGAQIKADTDTPIYEVYDEKIFLLCYLK